MKPFVLSLKEESTSGTGERRDSKGQKNIFNYKLLEKRASEMDSLLEEPYKPITQMCYKNLRWADWHKMHAFVPIFQKSREPLFYLEI